jgi:hypothetical protein
MAYIFFLIWSSFFYFFGRLLNWFFFSISPFIQKIICIFYFNFDLLSFDFFFVLLINWFFFSISPFNQKIKFISCFNFDLYFFNFYFIFV